jgi:hypothetical protein
MGVLQEDPRVAVRRSRRVVNSYVSDHQHHSDLGALRERVSNAERGIDNVSDQVATLQRDTARQIENLQTSLSSQIRDVSSSFAASRSTNWGTIIAAVMGVVVLGGAVLTPIMSDIGKTAEALEKLSDKTVTKDVFQRGQDDQNNWLANLRDRTRADEELISTARIEFARFEGRTIEQHETFLKEHALLIAHVDALDGNLIKRPEIEAALGSARELTTLTNSAMSARVDAVISSLNELRHDVGATYTWGDGLKHALERIDGIQQEINALSQTLGRQSAPNH